MDHLVRDEKTVDVRHLIDVSEAESMLERWFVEEWEPYYGTSGPGDARADLRAASDKNSLPICLVAVDAGGGPIGTIALKAESVASHRHLSPWVAAFLVAPDHRGRGIGTVLLAAAEKEARRLGFKSLYIATDVAVGLLERRNWYPLRERAPTLRGSVEVYVLDL